MLAENHIATRRQVGGSPIDGSGSVGAQLEDTSKIRKEGNDMQKLSKNNI